MEEASSLNPSSLSHVWKDLFSSNGHAVDNVDLITSRKARQPRSSGRERMNAES
jgi:hypothetical protein